MRFLLDTHILLWWYLDEPTLSTKYANLLTDMRERGEEVGISVISLWEIAKIVSLGKFEIDRSLDDWFEELEEEPILKILPLNSRIILESTRLGRHFQKDPADQLIAATARHHGLRLLTVDQEIIGSGVVAIA